MKRKSVPYWNRSHSGWWWASYLVRFEYYDEKRKNLSRRCLAWENTILIKASTREQAFRKAVRQGKLMEGMEAWDEGSGRKGAWLFEGLTSLLPIYQPLADGMELFWVEHAGRTVRKIRALVKNKKNLEVFDDHVPLKLPKIKKRHSSATTSNRPYKKPRRG